MYATIRAENVAATTPRISGARRALESNFNFVAMGISTLVAAIAIAFAASGTALAVGDQALWVANAANVVEFGTLPDGTHDQKPKVELNSAVFGAPQGVVFDAHNNLWVIDGGTVAAGGAIAPSLEEFTEAQLKDLKKVPMPMPNVQIFSGGFAFPQQAVFDAAGNMWVSDSVANRVWVITPAQLAVSSANLNFTTTIKAVTPPFVFNGALGIVLAKNGNLWVSNVNDTTIFEFNANHLPAINQNIIANLTPDVVLSDDGHGSIQGPWALVFDTAGDLWSSNANSPFTLVKFGPNQITATGDPTPETTISPFEVKVDKTTDESLAAPNGIAFDEKNELAAISSASPFGVAGYDPKQQMVGGSIKPDVFLVGANTTLNAPAGDNFGPDINK
jgi:sugar lactone lactonase YvrE